MEMEQIFKKDGNSWVSADFAIIGKAGDVAKWMKENHPCYKIGFKAMDIGLSVYRECKQQGFGEVLWMK